LTVLDIARGAYVRSPKAFRDVVSPALALLPVSLKYGRAYQTWRGAIARSRSNSRFTQKQRLGALRSLLGKAFAGSPFWQERISQALGTRPDLTQVDFETLCALPLLTKESVRSAGEEMLAQPAATLDRAPAPAPAARRPRVARNGAPQWSTTRGRDRPRRRRSARRRRGCSA